MGEKRNVPILRRRRLQKPTLPKDRRRTKLTELVRNDMSVLRRAALVLCLNTLSVVNVSAEVITLSEANFDATVKSADTFVKFYAPCAFHVLCPRTDRPARLDISPRFLPPAPCSCSSEDRHLNPFAAGCGHCKKLTPVWDQLAASGKVGDVNIGRVDMTVHKSFAKKYAIQAFPTLLFFSKHGKKIYRYSGSRTYDALLSFVQGGWKSTEEYDPTKQPPPKPRRTMLQVLYETIVANWKVSAVVGCLILFMLVFVVYSCCLAEPEYEDDELASAAEYDRKKAD